MEYRRFGNRLFVRMDTGEEILAQLENVCRAENIRLAEVKALGALQRYTVGLFDPADKEYHKNTFEGPAEITGLWGTVTTMDGEYYAHIHMNAANADGAVTGGHLNEAVVGPTCEMIIEVTDGTVERVHSDKTGLNLFKFE
ncbi:MAG: PPC domain-containing DNA-binding protein [Anaerovoracaceae bacterium]|nr:PPC domain-containing DNA-binding protein [Anaerovoracaceae bacterium]